MTSSAYGGSSQQPAVRISNDLGRWKGHVELHVRGASSDRDIAAHRCSGRTTEFQRQARQAEQSPFCSLALCDTNVDASCSCVEAPRDVELRITRLVQPLTKEPAVIG